MFKLMFKWTKDFEAKRQEHEARLMEYPEKLIWISNPKELGEKITTAERINQWPSPCHHGAVCENTLKRRCLPPAFTVGCGTAVPNMPVWTVVTFFRCALTEKRSSVSHGNPWIPNLLKTGTSPKALVPASAAIGTDFRHCLKNIRPKSGRSIPTASFATIWKYTAINRFRKVLLPKIPLSECSPF